MRPAGGETGAGDKVIPPVGESSRAPGLPRPGGAVTAPLPALSLPGGGETASVGTIARRNRGMAEAQRLLPSL